MKKLTVTIELEEQAGETYDNETYSDLIKEAIECNTTAFVHEVNVKIKEIMTQEGENDIWQHLTFPTLIEKKPNEPNKKE